MSLQATVTLNTLRCITEGGFFFLESEVEPYIWAFLASIATNPGTFETSPDAAILAEARHIIKKSMKAGETAQLEYPGNTVSLTFEDGQKQIVLVLVVALLEADDNTDKEMQSGYQAFIDELRSQLGHNLLALLTATPDEATAIIDQIKKAVKSKVTGAVENSMSGWGKFKVAIGEMDPDDFIASDTQQFTNVETLTGQNFTLHLANDATGVFRRAYELDGSLAVSHPQVDPCQAQVDAVTAAEQKITGLQGEVTSLQLQLQHATPQEKSGIIHLIEDINQNQIPQAEAALERAKRALRICRLLGGGTHEPITNSVLTHA
jgi:hypothetical protein